MVSPEDLDGVAQHYTESLRTSGTTAAAVGWRTEALQELRFDKLTSVIDDRSVPVRINDYGCGYGAHLRFLIRKGIRVSEYHGYDVSAPMLEAAAVHLTDLRECLDLRLGSEIETVADFSFVSGTFNVRLASSEATWKTFVESRLDQLHEHSARGFAFNMLTSYVDWRDPHLYYGDPAEWFDYCKRRFSPRVALLHDYPLYEWTMVVRKPV